MTDDYRAFLQAKAVMAPSSGIDVPIEAINPTLKPHTRAIVRWALAGGRRAVFASFGLHKTSTQIEIMRLLAPHCTRPRLIILPLGVRREFFKDANERFVDPYAVELRFIRRQDEIDGPGPIYLTNYESVRDGKIDPRLFDAVSLDEASVLRSFGSKTFQTFLAAFEATRFKFVATATPSPNRFKELIHYAGFLGVMDTGQALTRFFQRNPKKAGDLTLYPHKEEEFWLWVASWACFVQQPSDLGFSDDGYALPPLTVRWHEVEVDIRGTETGRDGQMALMRDPALGLAEESRERRSAIPAVVDKIAAIVAAEPQNRFVLWHDLEEERRQIERAVPGVSSVFGTQELEDREARIGAFADGEGGHLSTKPIIAGSGTNIQRHCHRAVYAGVGHKFNDFIQSIHRLQRFGQTRPVEIDIVYPETMRAARQDLEAKWARHEEMAARMSEIIQQFGLSDVAIAEALTRSLGVERIEATGEGWRLVNNDCVLETKSWAENSVDLVVTSIPFSNHYEYTPSYHDFGHTDGNAHFFEQLGFLTAELLRILKPGRLACIHVKDRIEFGAVTGHGVPTVDPFHADCIAHYRAAGFLFMGMVTVVTDVVAENNQTYRLGYTEMRKDSTKMGVGCPEYVLLLRKPQSNKAKGYADEPVVKTVEGYSLARWQIDAHALWRSSGDRFMSVDEIMAVSPKARGRLFTAQTLRQLYDFEGHVRIGEALEGRGHLPSTFMSLAPGSHHPDVWHDVLRIDTINRMQVEQGREKHLCPLQFDIVDRLIERYSAKGELVFDPFAGLGTVPYRALKLGRRGAGTELSPTYFLDAVKYLQAEEARMALPTLFDAFDALAQAPARDAAA